MKIKLSYCLLINLALLFSTAQAQTQIEIINAELQRIPTTPVELTEEQEAEFNILLDMIEEDDDVVKVYTTLM